MSFNLNLNLTLNNNLLYINYFYNIKVLFLYQSLRKLFRSIEVFE